MTFIPKILVIDDEKRIRNGCVKMLVEDGLSASAAESAEAGLASIAREHFDIILLDLMMPGMSGLDALLQLRRRHPDTVVIVITGYATLEYSVEAMKKGAFDFIPKPFAPEDLRRVVRKALDHIRTLQDIANETSRMRVLINQLSDGVLAVDQQEKIVLANPAALRLVRYDGPPVIGCELDRIVSDPVLVDCLRRALQMRAEESGEILRELNEIDLDSGEGSALAVRTVPFRDRLGRTLGALLVLNDITALKKIDLLKSQFVSLVAHEIRSPMNTVLAQMHVLMDGLAGEVTAGQTEILKRCSQKVHALAEMATQLLDLSKIESGSGAEDREDIGLADMLLQQVNFHQEHAAQKRICLELAPVEGGLRIEGSLCQLREAVANLISNALKYTPDGGRVAVSAGRRGDCARIRVSDTGIGIDAEDQERIFKRFYRVKNEHTRFIIGTGLGLALVKRIVETHGGRIEVDSAPGRGSTFTIELPLGPSGVQTPPGDPPPGCPAAPPFLPTP